MIFLDKFNCIFNNNIATIPITGDIITVVGKYNTEYFDCRLEPKYIALLKGKWWQNLYVLCIVG